MKERYLSETPNVTFLYLSKCNIKLPCFFGNSKKRFLWSGILYTNPEFNAIHFSNGVSIGKLSLTVLWTSRILKIKNQTNRNEMKWLQQIFQEWKDSAERCSTQGQSCTSCKTALIQMWGIQILKHWNPIFSLQYFEFWVLSDHYKTI